MTKLVLVSLAVAVGIAGAGWLILARRAPAWSGTVLWFSAGVNVVAGWIAFIPIAVVARKSPELAPQAALAASAIRLLIVAPATLLALKFAPWSGMALSVWMMVFYFALLAIESGFAIHHMRVAQTPLNGAGQT